MASVLRSCRSLGNLSQNLASLFRSFSQLRLSSASWTSHLRVTTASSSLSQHSSHLHTSNTRFDLMEFFDRKDVWGDGSVLVGRPWRKDELRLKSSQDLHKLWYVLLKERNVLLTMQAEYNRNQELFPNPERMEKVEESMENILEVVRERDDAISMLETGESTDKGSYYVQDFLGRTVHRRRMEYAIPPHMNKVYRLMYPKVFRKENMKYLALYREKIAKKRYAAHKIRKERNRKLADKFPHLEGKLEESTFIEPRVS